MLQILEGNVKIKKCKDTLDELVKRTSKSDKVFFVRFGDNCLYNMIGIDGKGRKLGDIELGHNKTKWTLSLQEDMFRSFVIDDPNYMVAMTGSWGKEKYMVTGVFGSKRPPLVDLYTKLITSKREFYNPICFHYYFTFFPNELHDYLKKIVKGKNILYIGSVKNVTNIFKSCVVLHTAPKNSYESKDDVLSSVWDLLYDVDVVISATGQLTRAMAHHLWNHPAKFHYIDIGSFVDAFDMNMSRGYLSKMDHITTVEQWTAL